MSKIKFEDELKAAKINITDTRFKSATKRAQKIIKLSGTELWSNFSPLTQSEKINFITTGILTRSPFVSKIRLTRLMDGNIKSELTRARTLNLVQASRSAKLKTENVIIDGETVEIEPPHILYTKWQHGEITTEEYIDKIELWKNNSRYVDTKGNLRYGD